MLNATRIYLDSKFTGGLVIGHYARRLEEAASLPKDSLHHCNWNGIDHGLRYQGKLTRTQRKAMMKTNHGEEMPILYFTKEMERRLV